MIPGPRKRLLGTQQSLLADFEIKKGTFFEKILIDILAGFAIGIHVGKVDQPEKSGFFDICEPSNCTWIFLKFNQCMYF